MARRRHPSRDSEPAAGPGRPSTQVPRIAKILSTPWRRCFCPGRRAPRIRRDNVVVSRCLFPLWRLLPVAPFNKTHPPRHPRAHSPDRRFLVIPTDILFTGRLGRLRCSVAAANRQGMAVSGRCHNRHLLGVRLLSRGFRRASTKKNTTNSETLGSSSSGLHPPSWDSTMRPAANSNGERHPPSPTIRRRSRCCSAAAPPSLFLAASSSSRRFGSMPSSSGSLATLWSRWPATSHLVSCKQRTGPPDLAAQGKAITDPSPFSFSLQVDPRPIRLLRHRRIPLRFR